MLLKTGEERGTVAMADEQEEQQGSHVSPFEAIRQVDEQGNEYWSARSLATILDYNDYRNFLKVIGKAKIACEQSSQTVLDHFGEVTDMITVGKGAQRKRSDVHLSRYACYLVIQNADPEKTLVSLGQTYFAVQTRRQELADEDALAGLSEDQKRLLIRGQVTLTNLQLAETASHAGVITTKDFAIFQDHGYQGLYGGLRAADLHRQKGLKKSQKILDYMNSSELAANMFRATQTEEKIRREGMKEKDKANEAHRRMGQRVRQFIAEEGGTMPEDQPTPTKSIQQLQREQQKRLEQGQQPSLFDQLEE
jgi:DNA-damage-inducible protein D